MHISTVHSVRISHAKKKPWDFCSGCNLQQKRINLNCMSNIYFPSHYMFDKIGYDTSSLAFSYLAETTQKRRLHPLAQYTKKYDTEKIPHLQSVSIFLCSHYPSQTFHKEIPNYYIYTCLLIIGTREKCILLQFKQNPNPHWSKRIIFLINGSY